MTTCIERALVDSHFRGVIAPPDERRMREHVTDCASCKAHYRRRQILAQMDPEALPVEERLGRGLGIGRRPRTFVIPATAAAILAVAAILFFVVRPAPEDDGFTARGSVATSTSSTIAVYRVSDRTLLSTSGALRAEDELAFSYENTSGKPYFMIFGVDEDGAVYWFYPAWTKESENPTAVKTDPDRVRQQLSEAIRHPLAGKRLTIHGLFVDEPLTVRDVESRVRENSLTGMPGAVDQITTFEVTR